MSSALSSINSGAGRDGETGASKARILYKDYIPAGDKLAILSAGLSMTFSKAMGTFGVPSVLGLKIGYYTVSSTMYNSTLERAEPGGVCSISLILIAIASFSVFLSSEGHWFQKILQYHRRKGQQE